jgi:putative membrane protein insertion efficiency factor
MHEFPKFVVLQILRGYKWAISPMLPPACRFVPTCSEYAAEAVERYGVVRGGWVTLIRLLRCHPFSRGGHDPVIKRDSGENENPHPSASSGQGFSQRTREMGHSNTDSCLTTPVQHQGAIFSEASRTL